MKLFDYVDVLLKKKPYNEDPSEFEREFSPWIINRLMSCDQQIAVVANEVNMGLYTKKMTFDLYRYGLPKINRFVKYSAKAEKASRELKYVMEFHGMSMKQAKDFLALADPAELKTIVDYYEKRGRAK